MTKVSTQNFRSLAVPDDVEKAFREPLALVFKHGEVTADALRLAAG